MKLVDLETLKTMPNGTVFVKCDEYGNPNDCLTVLTGRYDDRPGWDCELQLLPWIVDMDTSYQKLIKGESVDTVCETDDSSDIDYNRDVKFTVFNKAEVKKMIEVLTYAYDYPNSTFDDGVIVEGGDE